MSTAELATSYAALILADDGVEITVCASIYNYTSQTKEVFLLLLLHARSMDKERANSQYHTYQNTTILNTISRIPN